MGFGDVIQGGLYASAVVVVFIDHRPRHDTYHDTCHDICSDECHVVPSSFPTLPLRLFPTSNQDQCVAWSCDFWDAPKKNRTDFWGAEPCGVEDIHRGGTGPPEVPRREPHPRCWRIAAAEASADRERPPVVLKS